MSIEEYTEEATLKENLSLEEANNLKKKYNFGLTTNDMYYAEVQTDDYVVHPFDPMEHYRYP